MLLAIVLVALATGLCSAEEPYRPVVVSLRPEISIPLVPDHFLFQLGGGGSAGVSYVFPSFRPFSAGTVITYHYVGMQHGDLGYLGSLSVVSAAATAELRATIARKIDLSLAGGAGFFCAFLNEEPTSYASNFALAGRIGVGFRATPAMTVGLHAEYRRYETLYHAIVAGLAIDLWP